MSHDNTGLEERIRQAKIDLKRKLRESRRNADRDICLICGLDMEKACHSHSIPKFALTKISNGGFVTSAKEAFGIPILEFEEGIKREAGIFRNIHPECDNTKFKEYEDKIILMSEWTNEQEKKILQQIALKNTLKNIYKRDVELILDDAMGIYDPISLDALKETKELDLMEYHKELTFILDKIKKGKSGYHLFRKEILDYEVDFVLQQSIVPAADTEGSEINNLYNYDPTYITQDLHLLVLPVEGKTIVLVFSKTSNSRFKSLKKQIRKMANSEYLEWINYLIFSYSEDFFYKEELSEVIAKNSDYYRESMNPSTIKSYYEIKDELVNIFIKE